MIFEQPNDKDYAKENAVGPDKQHDGAESFNEVDRLIAEVLESKRPWFCRCEAEIKVVSEWEVVKRDYLHHNVEALLRACRNHDVG